MPGGVGAGGENPPATRLGVFMSFLNKHNAFIFVLPKEKYDIITKEYLFIDD